MIFLYTNLELTVLITSIFHKRPCLYFSFLQGGPGLIHYSFNYYGNSLLQTQMVKTEDACTQNSR